MKIINKSLLIFILMLIALNLVTFNAVKQIPVIGVVSLNYLLLFLLAFRIVKIVKINNFKLSKELWLYIFFLFFYVIYSSMLSMFISPIDIYNNIQYYVNILIILLLVVVIYTYLINKSKEQLQSFVFVFLTLLTIGNIITIIQYIYQLNWISDARYIIIVRAYGLYLNPNIAGYISITSIIFAFYLLLFSQFNKLFVLIYLLVAVTSGVLTFSKTFFLNAFFIILVYLFYRKKYIKTFNVSIFMRSVKYILLLILSLFFNYSFTTDDFRDKEQLARLESVFFFMNDSEVDYSGRSELAEFGLAKVKENPIIGTGYGSFTVLKESNKLFDFTSTDFGVHNTFIRIWGEGGIVSILFYLFFWLYLLYKVYSNSSVEVKMISYMLIFTLNIYSLTSHNIPEDYFPAIIIVIVCVFLSLKNKVETTAIS